MDLIEFSYNKQSSCKYIGMALFEALYGRKCRRPVCWNDISETVCGAWSRIPQRDGERGESDSRKDQGFKSYADLKRRDEEFQVGEKV